jgi:hypothetical protein
MKSVITIFVLCFERVVLPYKTSEVSRGYGKNKMNLTVLDIYYLNKDIRY